METQYEQLDDIELQKIYLQLSESSNFNFDYENEERFVFDAIEECYPKDFRMIDSKELMNDINKLNLKFIELINYLVREKKYSKIHVIFCAFCDYFDLPTDECYKRLHEKIQSYIKRGFVKLVGKKEYIKLNHKYNVQSVHQLTLFDLVRMKNQKVQAEKIDDKLDEKENPNEDFSNLNIDNLKNKKFEKYEKEIIDDEYSGVYVNDEDDEYYENDENEEES